MLILASNSPRRKELLSMLGYEFVVKASDCDESTDITEPAELVKELSLRKAKAVKVGAEDTVIGSDTVVAINGKILGKPVDENDAAEMLKMLSNKTHTVYTGVTVIQNDMQITEVISCDVTFKKMTETEILNYIKTKSLWIKPARMPYKAKARLLLKSLTEITLQ